MSLRIRVFRGRVPVETRLHTAEEVTRKPRLPRDWCALGYRNANAPSLRKWRDNRKQRETPKANSIVKPLDFLARQCVAFPDIPIARQSRSISIYEQSALSFQNILFTRSSLYSILICFGDFHLFLPRFSTENYVPGNKKLGSRTYFIFKEIKVPNTRFAILTM